MDDGILVCFKSSLGSGDALFEDIWVDGASVSFDEVAHKVVGAAKFTISLLEGFSIRKEIESDWDDRTTVEFDIWAVHGFKPSIEVRRCAEFELARELLLELIKRVGGDV